MAVKIKARGRQATKPTESAESAEQAPKRKPRAKAKPKPAAKRTPVAKRTSSTKAKPAAKRGPGRPRKEAAQTQDKSAPVRRSSPGVDPREEAKRLKLVTKMGERRAKAEAEHKESINALHQAAKEALEAGVSMAKVSDASGISRQWLYKMGDFRGRNGSNGDTEAKAPAKAAPTRKASKPAARKNSRQTQAKQSGTRRRVAIRSAG